MATRETIIKINLDNKDALNALGKMQAETIQVNDSIKLLNSIIRENGKATDYQARQLGELISRKKNLSANIRELSNETSGLTAAGMRFRDKMADATLEAVKQSGILGQLAARADFLDKQLEDLNASYKSGSITQQQYNAEQKKLQAELGQTTTRMTAMDAKLDELNKDFQTGKITAEQFKAGVQSVNTEVAKAGGRFSKGVADLKSYALGMVGVVAAVQGIRAVFSNVMGIIADFDKAQSRLAGILGTTKEGMAALTEQAKQLGATTAFTASQVADAQTELAKLGFTQNEILAATPALLDLARGAGADIAQAAEIAAGTLNAFGLSAEETTRLADVMAKSFSSTALDIDKFSFAMRVVGPVAKNAGLSIEETTALIGVLADNNIRAETSGTGLRNILGKLAQTGMTFEEAMRLINTSTDKTKTAIDLFGLEASTVAIVLAENTTKTGELTEAFDKAAGSAKDLAVAMDDNLIGDKLKLTSAWEGFVLSVDKGNGVISKALRGITSFFTDIFTGLTAMNNRSGSIEEFTSKVQKEFEAIGGSGKLAAKEGDDVVNALRLSADSAKEYGNEMIDVELMRIEAAKIRRQLDDANFAGNKVREAAARAALKIYREEIAVREKALETQKSQTQADAAEAQAKVALGHTFASVAARIKELKDAREQLSITDKEGIAAIDTEIKSLEASIGTVSKKTAAVEKLTDAQKAYIEVMNDLSAELNKNIFAIDPAQGEVNPLVPIDEEPERDPFLEGLPARMAAMEAERIAFEDLQQAKVGALGAFANALAGVASENQALAVSLLAVEKAAAVANVIISLQRELAAIAANPTWTLLPDGGATIKATYSAIAKARAAASIASILATAIQGFAQGGMVRQSDGPRYTRNPGDSVLISAAPGEVVMTREQQRRANMLAGFNVFAAARVPGFAVGGVVTTGATLLNSPTTPRPSPSVLSGIENAARMQAQPIFVKVQEINDVQGRVARVTERATL